MKFNRRQFAVGATSLAAAAAAYPALAAADGSRPMTEWYYADAIVMPDDTTPATGWIDVTGASTDWMSIFNLGASPAEAVVTRYFEDMPPQQMTNKLPPQATIVVPAQDLPADQLPRGKLYGVRVQTTVPVIVQAVRAEHQLVDLKPPALPGNSFMSRMAHPGPLGRRETVWGFGNGFIERAQKNKGWEETERVTVLNPHGDKPANIRFTFCYPGAPVTHECTVAPERVRTVNFMELENLKNARAYGLLVSSDVPVIVEQIRRCFPNFNRNPIGGWVIPGYPIGDVEFKLPIG